MPNDLLWHQSQLFLSKWEKLAIFIANPHSSNSVMEYLFAASGSLLLTYAINLGLPFCIWYYNALPVANLLVSEYKWNLPVLFGICRTGSFINMHLISSNESCCSFPQWNGLPFLVKSYMGFSSFCNSGQNIWRKFTTPAKLYIHWVSLVAIASELLLICFSAVSHILSHFQ